MSAQPSSAVRGRGAGFLRIVLAAGMAAWLAGAVPASGQSSPYVPVGDPAYRDLDVLIGRGLARGLVFGRRPYSRMAFARAAVEARERVGAAPGAVALRLGEALARMETAFAGELVLLCESERTDCPPPPAKAEVRAAGLEGTWADSPPRPIRGQLHSDVDADVAPLLQRNGGRALTDGWTLAGEATLDVRAGRRLAGQILPRVWLGEDGGGGASGDATLLGGYVRALFGNLAVDVGREATTHGHAREYGPVLSGNARGLDMIRLSMERPRRLPWIFGALGPVGFSATVADMDAEDTPGSKLIVYEGALRPHPNLELGAALLNHQGGGVGPDVGLGERIRDALFLLSRRPFYFGSGSRVASDKVLGLDARLTLPGQGLTLFLEMMTTDDHDLFKSRSQALWTDAAWTAGGRAVGFGPDGRLDAWLEAGRVGLLPYTHHEFTSGLAVERRILGSPLGPLGTGLQGGVDWSGPERTLSVAGAWERYSGDVYRNPPDNLSRRFKWSDLPDEVRVRATVAWTTHRSVPGVRATARLGWEHVARFDYTGRSRTNLLAQVTFAYVR